jgi:hydroxybutyrate-dimer hydrolase
MPMQCPLWTVFGSRGVYGAIGSAGDWGLKRGCAVALTDAGKGMGLYDLGDDTVHRIDGTRATRTLAGNLSHFAANVTDTVRSAFNTAFPNRVALKHAHSQMNPEKDWGNDTLAAVSMPCMRSISNMPAVSGGAAWVVCSHTRQYPGDAGSVSNGGAAVFACRRTGHQGTDRRCGCG